MILAWRVAWQVKNAMTETREDFAIKSAAAARVEALERDGMAVVWYRIDLEEAG